MRALDEAGHVGHDEGLDIGLLADGDDAQVGFESSEGVVGDLGLGCGDARNQRGFAGVGVADQADVGQQLEFKAIEALFAGAAQLVLARSLVDRSGEVLVAASAASAFGDHYAFIGGFKIMNQLARVLVVEGGADGDLEGDGAAVESGAVGAEAVFAALGFVLGVVAEMDESVVALRTGHDDVAAAAAVAAGGTAAGHEFFAAEGHAAIAAVAGFYANFGFIDEHLSEVRGKR